MIGCSADKAAPSAYEQLFAASKAAGVEVLREQVFMIYRGAETFVTAPIASWAQIPATELRKGINVAFAYVSTKEPKVPPGYYTIKALANDIRLGTVAAKAQLIDRQGKVVVEIPARVEIHSLTVPSGARTIFVTTGAGPDARPHLWLRCSNGQCFLFGVFKLTA
jgi:hypothetical protein